MATTQDGFFHDYLARTGPKSLTKWVHYLDVYEREFTPFRTRPVSFLELGIFRGGSIPMWKEFFAESSTLTFIDIDPECRTHEIEGTQVRIGSQADPAFLAEVATEFGPFDVILDDGSHLNAHQIASLQALWPHLADRGIYVVEDCHTSYWPGFGGGHKAPQSFIEFAKNAVDIMHSWYTEDDASFPVHGQAGALESVRFYDSITVLEKRIRSDPPTSFVAENGEVRYSRKALQVRGRTSVFAGKDGG